MIIYKLNRSDASHYSGIYKISIGEHTYIGSTKRTIWVRIKEHERLLKKNKHYNTIMQSWYNKCQEITFSVLEYCSCNYVCEKEQYYIDLYSPDINIVKHVAKY